MKVFDADKSCWVSGYSDEVSFLEDYVDLYKRLSRRNGRTESVQEIVNTRGFSFTVGVPELVFCASFSFYKSFANCIVFKSGVVTLLLLQFRSFCDGIIFPDSSVFVGRNQSSCVKRAELILDFYLAECNALNDCADDAAKVNGWICNQKMPYHFFYDHAPYLSEYLGFSDFNEKVITTEQGCFSDIKANLKGHHLEICNEIPSVSDIGFFNILIARDNYPEKSWHQKKINEFDNVFNDVSKDKYFDMYSGMVFKDNNVKIWIFDTGNKRKWVNRAEFVSSLESFLVDTFPGVEFLIISDGLTRPYFKHEKISFVCSSSEKGGGVKYLMAEGLDYHFKSLLASDCDIFITDAATSSIVPARFLWKRAFCLVGDSIDNSSKGHVHKDSVFIPAIERLYKNDSWILDPFTVNFDKVEFILKENLNEICF